MPGDTARLQQQRKQFTMKFLWTAEYSPTCAGGSRTAGPGVVLIVDIPDQASAPAALYTIQASGAIGNASITPLLTAVEVDATMKLSAAYTPPGA